MILIIILSFASLCSYTLFAKDSDLYQAYTNYAAKLKVDNSYTEVELKTIFQQLSPRYQTELLNSRDETPDVINHLLGNYLNAPIKVENILSHFEVSDFNYSCLLVNGISNKKERVSLYFRYINSNSWLIDNIAVEYLAEFEGYLNEPICDSKVLMKKRMEAWSK